MILSDAAAAPMILSDAAAAPMILSDAAAAPVILSDVAADPVILSDAAADPVTVSDAAAVEDVDFRLLEHLRTAPGDTSLLDLADQRLEVVPLEVFRFARLSVRPPAGPSQGFQPRRPARCASPPYR